MIPVLLYVRGDCHRGGSVFGEPCKHRESGSEVGKLDAIDASAKAFNHVA
jgi:hypothetical protein